MRTQRVFPDFIDKDMSMVILSLGRMKNLRFVLEGSIFTAKEKDLLLIYFSFSLCSENRRVL